MNANLLTQLPPLTKYADKSLQWLEANIFVTSMLLQLAVLIVVLVISFFIKQRLKSSLAELLSSVKFLKSHADTIAGSGILISTLWLIGQVIGITLLTILAQPVGFLSICANLTAAWIAIRFFSGFVKNPLFSKLIAIIGWTIAALNILGWLDPTISFMNGFAFQAGDLRISLLTVVKGLITLGLLIWVALALAGLTDKQLKRVSGLTPSLQVLLSKLVRIALLTFAILFGISSVGIDITALAVFSGAVGVGIGFGLQKIVSNFISGIILLMDRSIKPGDVIEVDDTYGWINKLSGRHVSVITRDGKEHLIPNEDLITQRVINWSYSSKAVRLKIPVGISYKADPHLAKKLILEAIKDIDRVLMNPMAVCLMKGYGDNSVDLELRVWIEDPSNGVANIKSEILFAIWDAFKENDIEIPFPQRDVHLDEELLNALKAK
jgi:small-conductance mechanosensitive channel